METIIFIAHKDIVDCVGGAVNATHNICRILAQRFRVLLVCYTASENVPATTSENVHFTNLRTIYPFSSYTQAINTFLLDNPAVLYIFSYPDLYAQANLHSSLARIPRLLLFRSRPDYFFASAPGLLSSLQKLTDNTAVQVLFDSYKHLLPAPLQQCPAITIPNAVDFSVPVADLHREKKKIIFLSRVEQRKGIELLIQSFKYIANDFPEWSVDIYGQPQPVAYAYKLRKFIASLGLSHCVTLKGIAKKPSIVFPEYDLCVFPSFFEGFPNGLAEAMSAGLPVVGLKGCTGVNELIVDEYNGFLCDRTIPAYATAMKRLMSDQALRLTLGTNARHSMRSYVSDNISRLWLSTVEDLITKRVKTGCMNEELRNTAQFSPFAIEDIVIAGNRLGNTIQVSILEKVWYNMFEVGLLPTIQLCLRKIIDFLQYRGKPL